MSNNSIVINVGIIDVACCGLRARFNWISYNALNTVGIIDVACCGLRVKTPAAPGTLKTFL